MPDISEIIDKFSEIQSRLTSFRPQNLRLELNTWDLSKNRASLILGPRGVGKTNLLLRESQKCSGILYVSADHPFLDQLSLWNLAVAAFLQGLEGLAIDEVHFAKDWSQHLKAIYDAYPGKFIWASDSSSAILHKSVADLSRRFIQKELDFLSFREYIHLKYGVVVPAFNPFGAKFSAFEEAFKLTNIMAAFQGYMQEGFRPIFLEGDYSTRVLHILEKSIHSDVPYFVPQIQENHLRLMRAIVSHLAMSPIPTINIEGMCSQWSLGKEKLYQLLTVMERLAIIQIVRFEKDRSELSKGAKIFLSDATLYTILNGHKGTRREALVVAMLRRAGKKVFASKDETHADFIVDEVSIEVGGASKKPKHADWVIRDDIEYPTKKAIPLWSLGMMDR